MIAFACNRRHNALAIENSVTFVSCGVSKRVHKYLSFIGLSTSRDNALECFNTLQKSVELNLKDTMNEPRLIQPFLCVDNVDFEARISSKRVEKSSRMFHGSWGYFHIIPSPLTPEALRNQFSLDVFLDSMNEGLKASMTLRDFLPDSEASVHWQITLKAQLATALQDYLIKPLLLDGQKKKTLACDLTSSD